MDRKRIGVFGGTFDPPHVGHQILAMEASDQLGLDQILWVLSPDPPHKHGKKITPLNIRIKLVEAAINEDSRFILSYVDIDRPGPHYVIDTITLLKEKFPKQELIFLMGGDSLHDILSWYKPLEFISICDKVGVMRRPGEIIDLNDLEDAIPELLEKVEFIDAPLLEISSNQIRYLISHDKPYRYYLPVDVYHIIEELQLYQEGDLHDEDQGKKVCQ